MKDDTGFFATRVTVAIALLASMGACAPADSAQIASGRDAADDQVVATVGGQTITMGDLRADIGDRLSEMDFQYELERYEVMEGALDNIVRRRLLEAEAARQGISLQELVTARAGGLVEVTDEEVNAWYAQNQSALQGQSLEALFPRIREFLINSRRERMLQAYARELAADVDIQTMLDPVRASFDNAGAPVFGPDDARVTLVEFSDFECPYCARFFPVLNQIKENYSDRVRIVYRQFPLTEIHPLAWKAGEASLCAHEQGRFWEMHDLLFSEQDRLEIPDLKEKAGRLGLDQTAFDVCLDSARYRERLQRDIREGQIYGVTGTPALFLNGVQVRGGAVPYEVMEQLIEDELAKTE